MAGVQGSPFNYYHLLLTICENYVNSQCLLPVNAKPEVFADITEYFMRINHVLERSSLLLDYDDGIMKQNLSLDGAALLYDEEEREFAMRYLLEAGPMLFEQIGTTLTAILFGGKNGKTIKELFEAPMADSEEEETDNSEDAEE